MNRKIKQGQRKVLFRPNNKHTNGSNNKHTNELNYRFILVAIMLIALAAVFVFKGGITGRFASGEMLEYNQTLGISVDSSQDYTWQLAEYPEEFNLKSLELSGSFLGNGTVKVYLETELGRFLVLDSGTLEPEHLQTITAYAVTSESGDSGSDGSAGSSGASSGDTGGDSAGSDSCSENSDSSGSSDSESADSASGSEADSSTSDDSAGQETKATDETHVSEETTTEQTESPVLQTPETTDENAEHTDDTPAEESPVPTEEIDEVPADTAEEPEGGTPTDEQSIEEPPVSTEEIDEVPADIVEEPAACEEIIESIPEIIEDAEQNETEPEEVIEVIELIEDENITDIIEENITDELIINENITIIEQNLTLIDENLTELNETLNLTENITLNETINETLNLTLNESLDWLRFDFSDICLESCLLPDRLNATSYKLVFEVEGELELNVDTAVYTVQNTTEPPVNVRFKVMNHNNDQIPSSILIDGEQYNSSDSITLDIDAYNILVTPDNHSIDSILFTGVIVDNRFTEFIKLDENLGVENTTKSFAINPLVEYSAANINLVAQGDSLYVCSEWDFKRQSCDSVFEFVKHLVVNETYSILANYSTQAFIETTGINATNFTYIKIKEDINYDAIIDSIEQDPETNDLTVIFHHNSPIELPILIKGDVSYTLDKNLTVAGENSTLKVYNWNDERFRILVGSHTEAFEFGTAQDVDVTTIVRDAFGLEVNATIELIDSLTDHVRGEKNKGQAKKAIKEGEYNIKVKLEDNPVKEIEFLDVEIYEDFAHDVRIDDVNETGDLSEFNEVYAIDPTNLNFTNATVTVTATGTQLYKCKEWNFTAQTCFGNWSLFKTDLVPGQEYTFTLTPEDPGFGELVSLVYDDCNGASIDTSKFTTSTTSGDESDIYASGTGYYILDSADSAEITLTSSGLKDNFTAFTYEANLIEDLGNGRGWTFGIGTGTLYGQTTCNSNTGQVPSNGYFLCFKGNNGATYLVRVNSGTETTLASSSYNAPTNAYHNYSVMMNTSGVYGLVDGNIIVSSTDTTYSQGYITASTGGGTVNRGTMYINNVYENSEFSNSAPTNPTSLTCNRESCNNTFYEDIEINCSGSIDADSDEITYVIEWLNGSSSGTQENSFADGFESGSITSDWSTYSSNANGRVQIVSSSTSFGRAAPGNVNSGSYSVWMDVSSSGTNNLNELITNYDFSGASDITLDFYVTESQAGDEQNSCPSSWTGHNNCEGVAFTCDGNTWYLVADISSVTTWTNYNVNITADPNFCSSVDSNFAIKFSQYDNYPADASNYYDGYGFDDIAITYYTTASAASWTELGNHTENDYYLWGLSSIEPQSGIDLRCRAIDLDGSNTYSDYYEPGFNLTIEDMPDLTPPAVITNLNYQHLTYDNIYWNWTNPVDPDFNENIIYLDGINLENTSNNYYNATGLSPETLYTITVNTKDTNGNINTTNVSDAQLTSALPSMILFDASSSQTGTAGLTWSHIVGDNNNRILIVGVGGESSSAGVAAENCRATSVTYNSISLTKADGYDLDDSGADLCTSIWYLLNPPVGTANVQVTYAGTLSESNAGAISIYNAKQQAPESTTNNYALSNPSSITTLITTLTDNAWVIDAVGSGNLGGFSTTQSNTERWDIGSSTAQAATSTKQVDSAGSTNMGWSQGANRLVHVLTAWAPYDSDLVPPASVNNLANQSSTTSSMFWNWTNPIDSDFNQTIIYLDGINMINLSAPINYYNATNLTENTSYTLTINTIDDSGNINDTNISSTAMTDLSNQAPGIDSLLLNSTFGTNFTTENLTAYTQTFDPEGDSVRLIYDWYVNNSPISLYNLPFEGKSENESFQTKDYSGTNIDLDVYGAGWSMTSGFDGRGAYEFYGTGEYIIDSGGGAQLNGLSELTLSVWIKSEVTNIDNGIIYTHIPDGDDSGISLRYDAAGANGGGTNVIKAAVSVDSVDQQIESSNNIQTTDWQNIVLVWKSGEQLKLYIDGELDSPTANDVAQTGTLTDTTEFIVGAGAKDILNVSGWDGLIDEVKLYRRALSEEQIKVLYQGNYDAIVSNETKVSDIWKVKVTPNDGLQDGESVISNNLIIVEPEDFPILNITSIQITPDDDELTEGSQINPVEDSNVTLTLVANITNESAIDTCQVTIYNASDTYESPTLTTAGTVQKEIEQTQCNATWTMDYWRNPGDWNITIYVNMTDETTTQESSSYYYNTLVAHEINISTISFSGTPGETVNSLDAYPMLVRNTGNSLINISLMAAEFTGLINSSYTIGVDNVTYNETVDGTYTTLSISYQELYQLNTLSENEIYFRGHIPLGTPAQQYRANISIMSD